MQQQQHQHPTHLSLIPQTPVPVFALSERRYYPRVFLLAYDNSKAHTRRRLPEHHEKHEVWGTLYPKGVITLDTGAVFTSGLFELREHFGEMGNYTLFWLEHGELREEETQA